MSNAVYPIALKAFEDADIDLLVQTIKMQLLDGYTYSAAHDFLNDVGGGFRIGSAVTLTGKTTTGGAFTATVPTFPSVPGGNTIDGLIIYVSTGVESTSNLCAFIDTRADTSALSIPTNGGPITLAWLGPLFTI